MHTYRVFFWDFDGTLYDTYARMARAVMKGMDEMGLSHEGQDVVALAKKTLRGACQVLGGDRSEELLSRFFAHEGDEGPESMRPYPGCEEALRAVVDAGGLNFLYTHRNHTAVDALKQDGLYDLFRDFITWEAGFPDKPAPDALNWAIDLHRLERAECVMVGDRDIDALAGHAAGIASALYDPDGFYPDHTADFRLRSLTDVAELLGGAAEPARAPTEGET
ncbi:MAG TPA: HAD hydrolase-like protein [Candidatus Limnocylindria bacterium]|nr:HAD hydrolase-like protein [Candidatus Limnocylindria bacterium]